MAQQPQPTKSEIVHVALPSMIMMLVLSVPYFVASQVANPWGTLLWLVAVLGSVVAMALMIVRFRRLSQRYPS